MSARDNILAKLRSALAKGDNDIAMPPVQDYYATLPSQDRAARVKLLRSLLEVSHAEVIVAGASAWPALVAARLGELGVRRLALTLAAPESAQLSQALEGKVTVVPFDRSIDAWKQDLFDTVDAGFTVADSAIAATGTLILKSSPDLPRSLSLVPPLHVALVRAENIHDHMFAAAAAEQWADGLPTNLVMVSGPSKTSDIQQTLAYGAHGPKQMLVVIVHEGANMGAAA
ncbi:MAG TPA: lactate utilization protein C [Rhodocyclaceae bacterium]|nr:lactate utilization protein C [Rhodocyclaceae bacterium]